MKMTTAASSLALTLNGCIGEEEPCDIYEHLEQQGGEQVDPTEDILRERCDTAARVIACIVYSDSSSEEGAWGEGYVLMITSCEDYLSESNIRDNFTNSSTEGHTCYTFDLETISLVCDSRFPMSYPISPEE